MFNIKFYETPNPAILADNYNVEDQIVLCEANLLTLEASGLGSDFDGIANGPVGLEDCTKFPSITEELMRRGYSDTDIQKILGLNTMRVMEENVGK